MCTAVLACIIAQLPYGTRTPSQSSTDNSDARIRTCGVFVLMYVQHTGGCSNAVSRKQTVNVFVRLIALTQDVVEP